MIRVTKILLILCILFLAVPAWGAAYTKYISDDATGNAAGTDLTCTDVTAATCTVGSPCKTMTCVEQLAQDCANEATCDTLTIYLDRTDSWSVTSPIDLGNNNDKTYKIILDDYGTGAKPIIDGGTTNAGLIYGMIRIYGEASEIRDIQVQNSYGDCIMIDDGAGTDTDYPDNVIISGATIAHCGHAAINMGAGTEGHLFEYSIISEAGFNANDGPNLQAPDPYECGDDGVNDPAIWTAAFGCSVHPQAINSNVSTLGGITIRHNYIYNSWTEGIGANNNTVEYNVIGPTASSGIYAGKATSIIRWNLVFGYPTQKDVGDKAEFQNGVGTYYNESSWQLDVPAGTGYCWNANGISIDVEPHGPGHVGTMIQGNIVVGRRSGISFRYDCDPGWDPDGCTESAPGPQTASILNNTFIDNNYNISFNNISDWEIVLQDNVSICYEATCAPLYGSDPSLLIVPDILPHRGNTLAM
jgi:hypothetical protein